MLDMQEIENTITELENSSTTFDTCMKLASLYIIKQHHGGGYLPAVTSESAMNNQVEKEIQDILPSYQNYCRVKRDYQMHLLPKESVEYCMKDVCREIQEFVQLLYSSTDIPEERDILKQTVEHIVNTL